MTPEFSGAMPEDLMGLQRGQCLACIGTDWTTVRTLPPLRRPEDDPTPRIVAATREKFASPTELVPAHDPHETEDEFVQ